MFHMRIKSGSKGSAIEQSSYITRQGKHRTREDLVYRSYGNMPPCVNGNTIAFWGAADRCERANGAPYKEYVFSLPSQLSRREIVELVEQLVKELVGDRPYEYAIHETISSIEGKLNVHVHVMFSDRMDDGISRPLEQIFKRYNPKQPEKGGRKKRGGGKDRVELRNDMIAVRAKCAEIQNAALARGGYEVRVDHRTLKEQNVDRIPERPLGQARVRLMSEEEKKAYVAKRRSG
ncbi:MobA/MobL family protein [Rhodanobacter sp. BL-MT-08]